MRTILAWCILSAACAGGPQLHPDLHGQAPELLAAMREHSRNYHEPPGIYHTFGALGWPIWPYGIVVAIDGPMLGVRMKDPEQLPQHVEDLRMPISNPQENANRGDGIVAGRLGDVLICRFFPDEHHDDGPPAIGDSAYLVTSMERLRR